MARLIALAIILAASPIASAEQVSLVLNVKQKTQQNQTPAPFSGVGKFEIFRGDVKYANAACPDLSNKQGKLECAITCEAKDAVAKPLRVVPPGKDLRVRGFVAPAAEEVEILGCKLSPSAEREFVYVESGLALAELIRLDPAFAQVIKVDGSRMVEFADTTKALEVFKQVGASSNGKSRLAWFQAISGAVADAKEAQGDAKAAESAAKYSIGISNVLLNEIAKGQVDSAMAGKLKLTADKSDYYRNLGTIEGGLETKVGRSAAQNLLLNDVQTLKGKPHDVWGQGAVRGVAIR